MVRGNEAMESKQKPDKAEHNDGLCIDWSKCKYKSVRSCSLSFYARNLEIKLSENHFLSFSEELKKFYQSYLEEMKKSIKQCCKNDKPPSPGDRKKNTQIFTKALIGLISDVIDVPKDEIISEKRVTFMDKRKLEKPIDLYIPKINTFIEIKYVLDFNHVGSALFEAILCKKLKNIRFLVVGWYDSAQERKDCFAYNEILDNEKLPELKNYIDGIFALNPKYGTKQAEKFVSKLKEYAKGQAVV